MHDSMTSIKAMERLKNYTYSLLRKSEKYTKTDMVYLVKGGFWTSLSYITSNILALCLSIAFAHLLSKENYGTYQFILSISSILSALTLTGMNISITRSVARGFEGSFKKSIPVQIKYNTVASLAALIIALYYGIQHNTEMMLGVIIIGATVPFINALNTFTSFLGGRRYFKTGFWFGIFQNIPYYIVMIGSLFFISNPVILITVNFGVNLLIMAILHFVTIYLYKPNNQIDESAISYGKHLSLGSIAGTVIGQLDNILVFHYLGTAELAIYAFATNIPERLNAFLKSFSGLAFPKFSVKTNAELKAGFFVKSLRFALMTAVISTIYFLFAPWAFRIFFPQYEISIAYSQIYAIMLIFGGLTILPITALTASGAKKEMYMYNIVSPLINIITMFTLIRLSGIWGLIYAKGITSLLNYGLLGYLIRNRKI